jgi:16S rRNA (cytosine1402-N4)-methyltransferase
MLRVPPPASRASVQACTAPARRRRGAGAAQAAACDGSASDPAPATHQRRPRYSGANPRTFAEKYKELRGDADVVAHIEAKGNTAAGTHRPILVDELVHILAPAPGRLHVDATLGYGGHASAVLRLGARVIALDADGEELRRTQARLAHFGDALTCVHCNYSSLASVVLEREPDGVDSVLADLGVSSMQLDGLRGFSFKRDAPLDMRLDGTKGAPASERLDAWDATALQEMLHENADEPRAAELGLALAAAHARRPLATTGALAAAVRAALPRATSEADVAVTTRRVFQAVRIAVNDEFRKLDALLLNLPLVLKKPGGRVAVLTFHSGEDRRVKKAFKAGLQSGIYVAVSDVIRPSWAEQRANSRSSCAKLRWAQRAE